MLEVTALEFGKMFASKTYSEQTSGNFTFYCINGVVAAILVLQSKKFTYWVNPDFVGE